SMVLGRGICAAAGHEGWSWLSPAVGLAALTVVCKLAIGLPGRATTAVVVTVLLLVTALVVGRVRGAGWPPAEALLVAGLALLLIAFVLVLERARTEGVERPLRVGVPAAILLAGTFYSYSYFGLVWPAATLGVWAALALGLGGAWRRGRAIRARVRASWKIL